MELEIREIIEGVSNTQGTDFIQSITEQLAKVVKADYTFVAKLDIDNYLSRTLSMVVKGSKADNMEYSLAGMPCANVADDSVCCYPNKVVEYFPEDQLLIDMGIEAYLGTPLHDSKGNVFGLIVALYETPIEDEKRTSTLFQIFSGRISAELERRDYEHKLLALNESLEQKVVERTTELTETLHQLKSTQEQLIESEKNAALGGLVAGVAHEVNTPLGIAITAHSIMADRFNELSKKIQRDELSIQDMSKFQDDMRESLVLQQTNLDRAKRLIENFKKTASDQHESELESIHLKAYYQQVLSTLKPLLKEKSAEVTVSGDAMTHFTTYPGVHAQILTNLISNSVKHGFKEPSGNQIHIALFNENGALKVVYQDNGTGLTKEQAKNIFTPFFTTARKEGGTGLGMSIVYNLITQKLRGRVHLGNNKQGFILEYYCPEL
jgi:signal transduction histidine kinase